MGVWVMMNGWMFMLGDLVWMDGWVCIAACIDYCIDVCMYWWMDNDVCIEEDGCIGGIGCCMY